MKVKRTNKLRLRPTKEQEKVLLSLCEMSAVLWNKVNYKRRQSFFAGSINWDTSSEYEEFKRIIGAATAQQMIRKNDEAWRSFLKLLRLKQKGKLPKHVRKISPPRYWKDRLTGRRKLLTVIRNDCYRIVEVGNKKWLVFRGLRIRITGDIRWRGKQGRLEIHYDDLTGRWYALQSVEVSVNRAESAKRAYADLGVVNIITGWVEGERQCIAFSGKPLLADWWYWTKKISRCQSQLKRVNGRKTSERLRKLYRKRRRRLRHAVNTIIHHFVRLCFSKGVGEVVVGDVSHIRENNDKGNEINAMIHNFWSFRYIIERLRTTAENFGIKVKLVRENGTSSRCPWCSSKNVKKHKRLFKCLSCGIEAHRDVVGVLNIARLHGDGFNGVLAHPSLLRGEEGAEVKADVAPMSVMPSEARISRL
ncbi:MAG: Transposase [Candidatus Alkanophagales archaeon MCA70_species_2]|nr:Transposase [Candidatus Alkanophaga liquidiphilum]RLG38970.1 MAG: transposase [Candidatus Alkanophagales archaeon]